MFFFSLPPQDSAIKTALNFRINLGGNLCKFANAAFAVCLHNARETRCKLGPLCHLHLAAGITCNILDFDGSSFDATFVARSTTAHGSRRRHSFAADVALFKGGTSATATGDVEVVSGELV